MNADMPSDRVKFYSTSELARMLNVDASTVKRWADSGKLQCYKTVGGHRRFSVKQLHEFVVDYHLEGIISVKNRIEPEGAIL